MRTRYSLVVAIAMLAAAGTALAESPWAGTWKLDPAQSKLTGDTIGFVSTAGGLTYTAGGHTTTVKLDGSPTKTWIGSEESWKKIDDNTYESHETQNGVDIGTDTWTLSPDGKSLKVESKETRPRFARDCRQVEEHQDEHERGADVRDRRVWLRRIDLEYPCDQRGTGRKV
jgi:hypothetical protein